MVAVHVRASAGQNGPSGAWHTSGVCARVVGPVDTRAPVDRLMRPSRYHAYQLSRGRILIALDADDIGFN